ncbi:MAG: gluconolaconase, partial [Mycobacterium sp.]
MQNSLRHRRTAGLLLGMALLAGCADSPAPQATSPTSTNTPSAQPPATDSAEVTVRVDPERAAAPFDEPRRAVVPNGWTLSVWARTSKPRLAVWSPDGDLLVSVPSAGRVLRFAPSADGPAEESVLLDGLDQPHGLAFSGATLYVAESDQIDAYDYAAGSATNPRIVAGGLPDARSPELRGAYSHALKSVAVGPDGAVYFSIGSTGNISAFDRTA